MDAGHWAVGPPRPAALYPPLRRLTASGQVTAGQPGGSAESEYTRNGAALHNGTAAGIRATRIVSHSSLHFCRMQDTFERVSL